MKKSKKKASIILDNDVYEKLIEEIEDIYFGARAQAAFEQEQEMISHKEIKRKYTGK